MSTNIQVRAGEAYIPRDELLSLVVGVFRARLSHNLSLTCRSVHLLSVVDPDWTNSDSDPHFQVISDPDPTLTQVYITELQQAILNVWMIF
jgi:DNA primase large subunit